MNSTIDLTKVSNGPKVLSLFSKLQDDTSDKRQLKLHCVSKDGIDSYYVVKPISLERYRSINAINTTPISTYNNKQMQRKKKIAINSSESSGDYHPIDLNESNNIIESETNLKTDSSKLCDSQICSTNKTNNQKEEIRFRNRKEIFDCAFSKNSWDDAYKIFSENDTENFYLKVDKYRKAFWDYRKKLFLSLFATSYEKLETFEHLFDYRCNTFWNASQWFELVNICNTWPLAEEFLRIKNSHISNITQVFEDKYKYYKLIADRATNVARSDQLFTLTENGTIPNGLTREYLHWSVSPNEWHYGTKLKEIKDVILKRFADKKIFTLKLPYWEGYKGEDIVIIDNLVKNLDREDLRRIRHMGDHHHFGVYLGKNTEICYIRPLAIIIFSKFSPKDFLTDVECLEHIKGYYWRYRVFNHNISSKGKIVEMEEIQ